MSTLHYFTNTNSAKGLASFFGSNYATLTRLARVSALPAGATADLVAQVLKEAAERDLDAQVDHDCLTQAPIGVLLPALGVGLFCPPFWHAEPLCGLCALDDPNAQELREALREGRALLAGALRIHDDWEKIYIAEMDFEAMNNLAQQCTERVLGQEALRPGGTRVERFFGAATAEGAVDYIQNLTEDIPKRYFLKGRPGTGKSTFLKRVAAAAVERGCRVEAYHCAFDPDSLDLVAVRELGVCIFDSTAPHEHFPERGSDEVIDVYAAAVAPGTDERNAEALANVGAAYKAEVKQATACFKRAAGAVAAVENTHLCLKAEALATLRGRALSQIFG